MNPDDYAKAKNIRDKSEYREVDLSKSNYEKGVGSVDKFAGDVVNTVGDAAGWLKDKLSKRGLEPLIRISNLKEVIVTRVIKIVILK